MFVGLIVLCIPAAARSWRHHLDSYQRVKSFLGSITLRRTYSSTTSEKQERGNSDATSDGPYSDLGNNIISGSPLSAFVEGPHTVVKKGYTHNVIKDSVHLTFEMKTPRHESKPGRENV